MIEDDMTPAERDRFEARLASDLAEDEDAALRTVPDLTAAIARIEGVLAHKRRLLAGLLEREALDLVPEVKAEIARLEQRRAGYQFQLDKRN